MRYLTLALAVVVTVVATRAVFAEPVTTLPWNNVVLNTQREIVNYEEDSTALLKEKRGQTNDICTWFFDITENISARGIIDPAALSETSVRNVFVEAYGDEVLADEIITALASRLYANVADDGTVSENSVHLGIQQICSHGGVVLIGGLDSYGHTVVMTIHPETQNQLTEIQPAEGDLYDYAYGIWYSDLVDRFIVTIGFGDAGWLWWNHHAVELESMSADLVERCVSGPDEEDIERVVQHCVREYIPN